MKETLMELIPDMDMPPFCRTQWVSVAAKEIWGPRVAKASQAYSKLERLTVLEGLRKCTTAHVNPENLDSELQALAKEGLVFLPRVKVGSYSGFAHRTHPAVEAGKPWTWYGPLAASPKNALEFVDAEKRSDHKTIGKLLGYPECDREHFTQVWGAGYIDPVWQYAENTEGAKFITDNIIELDKEDIAFTWYGSRYNGVRITPHLACSADCKETARISREWIDLGRNKSVDGISELVDLMNMPIEWNCLHGIAWVTTPIYRLVAGSVPCAGKFVVRKMGQFIPKEAATGLVFPFKSPR